MNCDPNSGEYHHYNNNVSLARATSIIVLENSHATNGVEISLSYDSFTSLNENAGQQLSPFLLTAVSTSSTVTNVSSNDKASTRRKRVPWSRLEDQIVLSMVEDSGTSKPNWSKVAAEVNLISPSAANRNGKQCRERWLNHLRSDIKKGAWTKEEETMIQYYYQMFGPKWSAMAQVMKNRTDNDIKNKWNSMNRSAKCKEGKLLNRPIHKSSSLHNIVPKQKQQSEDLGWEPMEHESPSSPHSMQLQQLPLLLMNDSLSNSSAPRQHSSSPPTSWMPMLHHHDVITATVTDRDSANHSPIVQGMDYWESNLDF